MLKVVDRLPVALDRVRRQKHIVGVRRQQTHHEDPNPPGRRSRHPRSTPHVQAEPGGTRPQGGSRTTVDRRYRARQVPCRTWSGSPDPFRPGPAVVDRSRRSPASVGRRPRPRRYRRNRECRPARPGVTALLVVAADRRIMGEIRRGRLAFFYDHRQQSHGCSLSAFSLDAACRRRTSAYPETRSGGVAHATRHRPVQPPGAQPSGYGLESVLTSTGLTGTFGHLPEHERGLVIFVSGLRSCRVCGTDVGAASGDCGENRQGSCADSIPRLQTVVAGSGHCSAHSPLSPSPLAYASESLCLT